MNAYTVYAPLLSPVSQSKFIWYPDGALSVDELGSIAYAGSRQDLPSNLAALANRSTSNIVAPGFIDAHTHLAQYRCRGRRADNLLQWLKRYVYPEELRFAEPGYARTCSLDFFAAMAQAGTCTASIYTTSSAASTNIAFEEAERSGLRIIMGSMMMDRNAPEALLQAPPIAIEQASDLINTWNRKNGLLYYAVSPRFGVSCSEELLKACGQLACESDVYIQTHINEQREEIEEVLALFPASPSYTEVYEQCGILTNKTLLGHNVHCSSAELDIIQNHGSSIIHCPEANLFLGSGRFPLEDYEGRSIHTGLGSDVAAGHSLCMLDSMRAMAHVQGRGIHPFIPLYAATLGNAHALRLESITGSLEPGKSADYIEMRMDDSIIGNWNYAELDSEEIASCIVYALKEQDIRASYVAGSERWRNHCE
jgi:guanine deaminase